MFQYCPLMCHHALASPVRVFTRIPPQARTELNATAHLTRWPGETGHDNLKPKAKIK